VATQIAKLLEKQRQLKNLLPAAAAATIIGYDQQV
jgi:hypothetical protein